jgi:hypothetical protein
MKIRELLAESSVAYTGEVDEARTGAAYTPEQLATIKQKILDYRKEGLNDREISKKMGKHPKWVKNMVDTYFPDLRQRPASTGGNRRR